ncbi:NAD(P)/FAD-dependent oxidoreductase [Rhodovibrionaceae bacterium A322]
MSDPMALQADIIIVGGGVVGAAIAYHLVKQKAGRVLVLERNDLASAATCRSPGFLLSSAAKSDTAAFVQATRATAAELSDELNDDLGFRQVGSIRTAASQERLVQLMGLVADSASQSQPFDMLTGDKLRQMVPWISTELITRAVHFPSDGFLDPFRLTSAYLRAAKNKAGELLEVRTHCAVQSLLLQAGRVCGVTTAKGETLTANVVIDASGIWASLLGERLIGQGETSKGTSQKPLPALPFVPLRHQHWITQPAEAFPEQQPMVLLPEARTITRPAEGGGLLVSVQELESLPFNAHHLGEEADALTQAEVENPWQILAETAAELRHFFPGILASHWDFYVAGLEGHTPDGLPLLGNWPGVEGLLVATATGDQAVATSSGVGGLLASLVTASAPPAEAEAFRLDRFGLQDPYGAEFRHRCLTARSERQKNSL